MDGPDIDPNFEPQTRARSNTWPLRPTEVSTDPQSTSPAPDEAGVEGTPQKEALQLNCKKTSSRRNAWGNLSYADLITKAIQSSPDQRLTLSQIYDWMVQNVPYFRDKGDSNSSAGWKNSIRHNLSLHNRFMRIQNEGTGKSSWWVINPDAKPGKPARRRTSSMDTKSLASKRDRVRKRVRELKNQRLEGGSAHISDDNFTLSPSDPNSQFRDRVDSTHSTHSGRLSPIPAVPGFDYDKELEDDLPWDSSNYVTAGDMYSNTTLVDSLIDSMKIVDNTNGLMVVQDNLSPSPQMMPQYNQNNNYSTQYNELPAPPPYPDHQNRSPRQQSPSLLSDLNQKNTYDGLSMDMAPQDYCQQPMVQENSLSMSLNSPVQQTSPNQSPEVMRYLTSSPYGAQPQQLSPKPLQVSPQPRSPQLSPKISPQLSPQPSPPCPQVSRTNPLLQQHLQSPNNSLLLKALTRSQAHVTQAQQLNLLRQLNQARAQSKLPLYNPQISHLNSSGNPPCLSDGMTNQMNQVPSLPNNASVNSQLIAHLTQSAPTLNQLAGQYGQHNGQGMGNNVGFQDETLMENGLANNSFPISNSSSNLENLNDIDLDSLIDVDCDVEQVLYNELKLDGNLDFNFEHVLSDVIGEKISD